jgi:hypothetical protein
VNSVGNSHTHSNSLQYAQSLFSLFLLDVSLSWMLTVLCLCCCWLSNVPQLTCCFNCQTPRLVTISQPSTLHLLTAAPNFSHLYFGTVHIENTGPHCCSYYVVTGLHATVCIMVTQCADRELCALDTGIKYTLVRRHAACSLPVVSCYHFHEIY